MDPIAMVMARPLPHEAVEEGRRLLDHLARENVPISAAFWLFSSEADSWQLVLASPIREEEGPLRAYGRLQEILGRVSPPARIRLMQIKLVSPKDRLVLALARVFLFDSETEDSIVEDASIDGLYVEAAYLYRLPKL